MVMPNGMIDQASSSARRAVDRAGRTSVAGAAAVADREDDQQRGDQQREEQADADEEEVEQVDLGGDGRRLLGEERKSSACIVVSAPARGRRASGAVARALGALAAQRQTMKPAEREHGQHAADADDVQHRRAVAPGARIVVEAEQQQLIDRRADRSVGGLDQAEPEIARRVLDAEEVARDAPVAASAP